MTTNTPNTEAGWLQLHYEVPAKDADEVSQLFEQAGALAVSLSDLADEPIYEPPLGEAPLWPDTRVSGLFPHNCDIPAIVSKVATALDNPAGDRWHTETVVDRAWERVWLEDFKPIKCGQRLWICPGDSPPPEADAINILLDPGLAFGSGTHPTTRLCLEWLDSHDVSGQQLIDYGCGSGILAIAAARLSAAHIRAVDIDPQAHQATLDNASRNDVGEQISLYYPEGLPQQPADVLIANILANPLIELMPHFSKLVKEQGWLVLSGILSGQAETVTTALENFFLPPIKHELDDWVILTSQRRHNDRGQESLR